MKKRRGLHTRLLKFTLLALFLTAIPINTISGAMVSSEPIGAYAKTTDTALLLKEPRGDSVQIGCVRNGSIMMVAQELSTSNNEYVVVRFDDYSEGENLRGYMLKSSVKDIAIKERDQYFAQERTLKDDVFSDPISQFQMPTPLYDVWLLDKGRHNVYSAPDAFAYRPKTKKGTEAYVSGNDTVHVLAKEGPWVLIEYETTTGNRRGYILKDSVSKQIQDALIDVPKADIAAIVLADTVVVDDTSMTNDNYVSRKLKKGMGVHVLAFEHSWGKDWAYIETRFDNKPMRGYIQLSKIAITR